MAVTKHWNDHSGGIAHGRRDVYYVRCWDRDAEAPYVDCWLCHKYLPFLRACLALAFSIVSLIYTLRATLCRKEFLSDHIIWKRKRLLEEGKREVIF